MKTKITAQVIDEMGSDVISISSDVYEQDVMLTGTVENEAQKEQAGAITAAIEDVKTVHNQIMVVQPVEKEKGAVENFVDDTVIETKINGLLLDARGVNVTNFRWRSVGGHVFLFGRALTAEENDKATGIAEGIDDVISVTNVAKIRAKD
ncbi:MAG: BON domain-containing protein [Rhodospirillales bacterium]|nr:BON domain-containing protein [Rhodospirillales bacterium]